MDSLYAGFISGIVQTIIGHPLDTLKTWSQNAVQLKKPSLNIVNLYKGISYPMIQNPLLVSTSFFSNHYLKEKTDNVYFSSSVTGIISGIISTPIDKYKIMNQQKLEYRLSIPNFVKSYKNINIMMFREIPANFIYYSSFEAMKNNNVPIFLGGGIAGVLSWTLTYPIDTIKSRMQSNSCKTIKEAFLQKKLLNGLSPCIQRAFIVNSFGMYVYEKMLGT
jgi:solute carrier family 25 carnitine/acylcarnitine transporter 20/29